MRASEDTPPRWTLGILNDSETVDVPGSVRLLAGDHDEPLGLSSIPRRSSASTLPTGIPWGFADPPVHEHGRGTRPKKTSSGMILDPQPEESANDPLNWPSWRRNFALGSVGLYCIVGGGLAPLLAAGFPAIAREYNVGIANVPLTMGIFMLGLGIGSVFAAPTAILYGKRTVYLGGAVAVILCSIWCALAPTFTWLVIARFFQGMAVSPVECLPGATIGEIFFLHEKAFRIGIYTLLLLSGKNLIPLISAAIIQSLDWRWVFWVMAMVLAFCGVLLFFFVPETFWDRKRAQKHEAPSWPSTLARRLSNAMTGRSTAGVEPGTFSPPSSGSASGIPPTSPRELEDMSTPLFLDKRDKRAHFADPPFPGDRINSAVSQTAVAAAEDPLASAGSTGSPPATAEDASSASGSVLDPVPAMVEEASASGSVLGPVAATPEGSSTPSSTTSTVLGTPEGPLAPGSIVDAAPITPEGSSGSPSTTGSGVDTVEASIASDRTLLPAAPPAQPDQGHFLVVDDGRPRVVRGGGPEADHSCGPSAVGRFAVRAPAPEERATFEDFRRELVSITGQHVAVLARDPDRDQIIPPNEAGPSSGSRPLRFKPLSPEMKAFCDSLDGHVAHPAEGDQGTQQSDQQQEVQHPQQSGQQQDDEQAAQSNTVAQLEDNYPMMWRRASRCICECYANALPTIREEGGSGEDEQQQRIQARQLGGCHPLDGSACSASSISAPSPSGSTPSPRPAMDLDRQRLALGMSPPMVRVGSVDSTGPFGPFEMTQEGRARRSSSTAAVYNMPGLTSGPRRQSYTTALRGMPPRTFKQQLKPYNGRLSKDSWLHVALRPFVLLAYPAVLWAAVVYACSMGWLVVLSQSVAAVFIQGSYRFTELQMGLTYLSPFIGSILGTAIAGMVSDVIVKKMARLNGGIYEPEFRLTTALPVLITTVLGLIGFGWSAQAEKHWMVPTFFFGLVSLGSSMGSTTAITFVVDSHRQYSGEALVAINLFKNVFHGMVFSLFFMRWLIADGSQFVFVILGVVHLVVMLTAVPMYVFGKRARMWTVRKNYVERFWHKSRE